MKLGSSPTDGSATATSETMSEYSYHSASLKYSSGNEMDEGYNEAGEEGVRDTALAFLHHLADALRNARPGLKTRTQ